MGEAQPGSNGPAWRRAAKYALVGLTAVGLLLACLPYLVAVTPLRNILLGAALAGTNVRATTGGASLGWFTPLALSGLQLKSVEGQPLVEVQQLDAEGPWWKLIASRPDLGQFRIQRPRVDLILSSDGSNFDAVGRPPSQGQAVTTLTAD